MARTIRPKIHARPDFLGAIPELSPNAAGTKLPAATDWEEAQASLDLDRSVPGEKERTFSRIPDNPITRAGLFGATRGVSELAKITAVYRVSYT